MAQIGEAIYDFLSTNTDLVAVHEGRVNAVVFEQGKAFPAMNFNTRGLKPLPCRKKGSTKQGQLQVDVLAQTPLELANSVETTTETIDGYQGTHLGWFLQIELSDDDFDEDAGDIDALYKALLFDLTATKLS